MDFKAILFAVFGVVLAAYALAYFGWLGHSSPMKMKAPQRSIKKDIQTVMKTQEYTI